MFFSVLDGFGVWAGRSQKENAFFYTFLLFKNPLSVPTPSPPSLLPPAPPPQRAVIAWRVPVRTKAMRFPSSTYPRELFSASWTSLAGMAPQKTVSCGAGWAQSHRPEALVGFGRELSQRTKQRQEASGIENSLVLVVAAW